MSKKERDLKRSWDFEAELKEIIINTALDSNFTLEELEFYTWLIWALGLQNS